VLFLAIFFVFNSFNSATAADMPFTIGLKLLKPIVVSETKPLSFQGTTLMGRSTGAIVSSNDKTAAKFNVTGNANRNIETTVVEDQIVITSPKVSKPIIVDHFIVKAPVALNSQGKGTITAGGTVHAGVNSMNGAYMGAATLMVVYQ
jgi:hypothetical protein